MSTDLFQKIIEEHKELSSIPQTLAEVLRVTKDDNSSAHDLAEVLRRDPALTVKILRVVNSPFYGAGRKITSVRQAVVALGMRAVTAVALSTSIYDMTGKWQSSIDLTRFWRHSLEVAVGARMIAGAAGYASSEEAFVSGLLHDIGLLILEESFPKESSRICAQAKLGEEIHKLEEDTWGTNHARVGQFLLEHWNLPVTICEAVGQHHDEFATGTTDGELRLPQMVALADMISRFVVFPDCAVFTPTFERKERLTGNLQLPPELIGEIEEKHLDQTLELAQFLEIDIGSQADLLIEANRMLYRQYGTVEGLLRENRQMQSHLALAQLDKAALNTLKTITATFNHYINNAVGAILGRAQLVEVALREGTIIDRDGSVAKAMQVIINGVSTIQAVLEELTRLTAFKTAVYHDDTHIIDIEKRLKKKLADIERKSPATP